MLRWRISNSLRGPAQRLEPDASVTLVGLASWTRAEHAASLFVQCQDETALLRVDENQPPGYDGHLHPSRQYGPPTGRLRHPDRHLTDRPRLRVTRQPCPGDFPSRWPTLLRQCHQWQALCVPALVDPSLPRISFLNRPRTTYWLLESPSRLGARSRRLPWIVCEAEGHECYLALAMAPSGERRA